MDIRAVKKLFKWFLIFIGLVLVVQMVGIGSRQTEMRMRKWMKEAVTDTFEQAASRSRELYGLKSLDPDNGMNRMPGSSPVILVHGLDEPGLVWSSLIPALEDREYWTLVFTYPNDQDIDTSARFFIEELRRRPALKGKTVTIVAHSMGGLVTRHMLTDPEIGYEDDKYEGRIPKVEKVIMVGTPNHGSQMARFRFVTEARDQFWHWNNTDVSFLHAFLDGAGEAGIDLLPGSEFLENLNAQPHPFNTRYFLVAGMVATWFMDDAKSLMGTEGASRDGEDYRFHSSSNEFRNQMTGWSATIGDGLVPVSSVALDGWPLIIVPGGHLDMIRNYPWQSGRTPPAVPVVLDLISRSY